MSTKSYVFAKVKRLFDLSGIYIKGRTIKRESSHSDPSKIHSRWIYIELWNVGDMRLYKFNEERIS